MINYSLTICTRKASDAFHPQSSTQVDIIQLFCKARFNFFIPHPESRTQCPWMLLISTGLHDHPPPPPKKTVIEVLEGIYQAVSHINDPDLSLSTS